MRNVIKGLPDEQFLALTALNPVVDEIYALLVEKTKDAMRGAGEDPENKALLALRVRQAAFSVDSQASRGWNEVCQP